MVDMASLTTEYYAGLRDLLTAGCEHYERTAPTVHRWMDDLYIRLSEQPDKVVVTELLTLAALSHDGWEQPNYAANRVYHMMHRLGRDVEGQSGF